VEKDPSLEIGVIEMRRQRLTQRMKQAGENKPEDKRVRFAARLIAIAKRLMSDEAPKRTARGPVGVVTEADVSITLDNSQYYQGCGTGRYDYSATGIGHTPAEAYEDALDMLFQGVHGDMRELDEKPSMRVLDKEAGRIKREKRSEIDGIIREQAEEEVDPDDYEDKNDYKEALEEKIEEIQQMSELYYYVCIQYNVEPVEG
jgi:hypothetical protein